MIGIRLAYEATFEHPAWHNYLLNSIRPPWNSWPLGLSLTLSCEFEPANITAFSHALLMINLTVGKG